MRNGKEKEPRGKDGSIATIRLQFGGDYFKKMRKSVSGRASDSFISISSLVSVQKFVLAEFFPIFSFCGTVSVARRPKICAISKEQFLVS